MKKKLFLNSFSLLMLCLLLQACLGFSNEDTGQDDGENEMPSNLIEATTPPILSIALYDYVTKEPIKSELVLEVHQNSPNTLYDEELYKSAKVNIADGFYNFALKKGAGTDENGNHALVFEVQGDGYFSRTFSLNMPDSGLHDHKLYLVPKENYPSNYAIKTHEVANLDPEINPLSTQIPNLEPTALARTALGTTAAAGWDTTSFIFEPNRSSVHWFMERKGMITRSRLTTATWSKIPELMDPYYIDIDDYANPKISLFNLKKTEVYFSQNDAPYEPFTALDTSYTIYGNRPKGKQIFSFVVTPGDFDDATIWYNAFMKLSSDQKLLFHTVDFGRVLAGFRIGEGGFTDNGSYVKDVAVNLYKPALILDYLGTVYRKETMANLFINDSLSGLLAKTVIVNFQWQVDSNVVNPGSGTVDFSNGAILMPLSNFHYYTNLKYKEVEFKFSATPPYGSNLHIVGGGQNKRFSIWGTNSITLKNPNSPSNLTLSTPDGTIEQYVDITTETGPITLNLPSLGDGKTNVDLKINLLCPTQSEHFKLDNLYNTSFRYRKTSSTDYWQVGSLKSFQKNQAKQITAAIVGLSAVFAGESYDIQIIGGGETILREMNLNANNTDGSYSNSMDFILSDHLCKQ